MATLNSYTTAKKIAKILLVALLFITTLPAKAQSGVDPIQCLIKCDEKLIKSVMKCSPGNFTCYLSCGEAFVKSVLKCFPKKEIPPAPPTIEVTGRLEASGSEMQTRKAVAIISSSFSPGESSIKCSLQFLQDFTGGRTHIKGIIDGLSPGLHGLHIQFVRSCSSMNEPHCNPENKEYGSQSAEMHRAYCLGNVIANPNGIAHAERSIEEKEMPLNGPHSVMGQAVIVHADEKVGCGIIEFK